MTTRNDERVLTLKEQIEKNKKELGKQPRFNPITTCMFTLEGVKVNIHTLTSIKDIHKWLIYFNTFVMSARDLNINCSDMFIDGFSILDWIEDLKSKKAVVEYTTKKEQLTVLEKKLDKLLSDDKKTELEIDAIAALLNDTE